MQNINFDDGYKRYILNDDENKVIRVNVTDFNILDRYNKAQADMQALIADLQTNKDATPEEIASYDKRIRENINFIFGSDVCTAAFGTANCMSVVSNGSMLFESFLNALMPQVQEDMGINLEAAKKRTDKYIAPVVGEKK
jgi:hypothetical protein